MRLFWYRAVTAEGAVLSGSGEHTDIAELVDSLAAQGLQPYRVWSLPLWLSGLLFRPLGVGLVAEFCYLVGQHLRAGADLRLALTEASHSASVARLRMLCTRLRRAVERGDSFAQALQDTQAFPVMLRHLVAVGEETGRLGDILAVAAAQFEQIRQLRSAIWRALLYPALVAVVLLASCVFWLVVVIPRMTTLFDSLNLDLPETTVQVLAGARWMQENGPWLATLAALLTLVVALGARLAARTPAWHSLLWWLPGWKRIERARAYHVFFSHLGAMHGAGLTISRTLGVLLQQPANLHLGRRLARLSQGALRGQSLSDGLAGSGAFERFALSLVRLGESTGTLDQQSQRLSEHYAQRVKQQIDTGSRLFEPVVLLVLAAFLLLIGVTLLGPVYELAAKASAGILR